MPKQKLNKQTITTLQEVLKYFNLTDSDWDILLVGDGSAGSIQHGAGWASVFIDKLSGFRKLFYGGDNSNLLGFSEFWPYIQALTWFISENGPYKTRKRLLGKNKILKVCILSDSLYTVQVGNGLIRPRKYVEYWRLFKSFTSYGMDLNFYFVPRNVIELHALADTISKRARKSILAVKAEIVTNWIENEPEVLKRKILDGSIVGADKLLYNLNYE